MQVTAALPMPQLFTRMFRGVKRMQLGSSRQRPRFVPKTSICQPPSAMSSPPTGFSMMPSRSARRALPSSKAGPRTTSGAATAAPPGAAAGAGAGARVVAGW